jgi:hypothetical protein
LVTGINPEDRSQIKGFVEKKLYGFAKEKDTCFSPGVFMKTLRKTSEAGMSESDFAQRDRIVEPFKVKVVKEKGVFSRRKKIVNGLLRNKNSLYKQINYEIFSFSQTLVRNFDLRDDHNGKL